MKTFLSNNRTLAAILALWLLISSCGLLNTTRVGDTVTEAQTVELGSASEARVQIMMGAGELTVAGDTENLMDATFQYNVDELQPRVDYAVNGSLGELQVDHQDTEGLNLPVGGNLVNKWDLRLNNDVPIDLEIDSGAGESVLDLRGLNLSGLRVEVGAGKTDVDMSSALDHDLSAVISGGVGSLSVKLPGDMGVRVSVDTGIGDVNSSGLTQDGNYLVNDAYGVSPNTLNLDISAGVGSIELMAP